MSITFKPHRGRVARRYRLIGVVICAVLGACAQQPVRTAGAWQVAVAGRPAYAKVLVLGVSPHVNQRCAFERALADDLRSTTVAATASCAVMQTDQPLTREAVERAVASVGADAVVAVRLVAASHNVTEGGTHETRGAGYYKPTGTGSYTDYWGVYGVPVVYGEFQTSQSVFTLQGSARLVTQVYQTAGEQLVYSAEIDARNIDSRGQALSLVPPAIADQLRRDGVVR